MANWVMPLFAIVVAVALFIEMVVILAAFVAVRRLVGRMERLADYAQGQVFPVISKVQMSLDQAQPHISRFIGEATSRTHTAREEMERLDRQISETSDRILTTLTETDERVSHTLALVERTGSQTRRALLAPIQTVKALLHGVETSIQSYLSLN